MSSPPPLDELREPQQFATHARNKGAEVDDSGFYIFVRTKRGITVFPRRAGDLPNSLRRHLVEVFMALGLAVLLVVIALL